MGDLGPASQRAGVRVHHEAGQGLEVGPRKRQTLPAPAPFLHRSLLHVLCIWPGHCISILYDINTRPIISQPDRSALTNAAAPQFHPTSNFQHITHTRPHDHRHFFPFLFASSATFGPSVSISFSSHPFPSTAGKNLPTRSL